MKKIWIILIGTIILGGVIAYLFSKKSDSKETVEDKNQYAYLSNRDIANQLLLSGKLQSGKEVNIKSELAGIIDDLYTNVGDHIKKGQAIAKIRILPDPRSTQDASRQLEVAQINLERIKANYNRTKTLYEKEVIPRMEYEASLQEYKIAQTDLQNAQTNLRIVRQGFSSKSDFVSNMIYSTIDGIVLDLPIKVGASIQNRNNFSEGTTLATIADENEYVFKGQVNEKDLRHLSIHKEMDITINALGKERYKANISKIAPKGIDISGITRFDFEAKLNIRPTDLYKIRSGFSATGELTIQNGKNLLSLDEKYIQYSSDTAYVYVRKGKEGKEKKVLTLGISDGQFIEIKSGLKKEDKILKEEIDNTEKSGIEF